MQVRKNVLTLSIIAALGISGAALAQETQSSDPAKELDAVVVIGIRGSLEQALDAASQGALPAEALGRLQSIWRNDGGDSDRP